VMVLAGDEVEVFGRYLDVVAGCIEHAETVWRFGLGVRGLTVSALLRRGSVHSVLGWLLRSGF